MRVSREPRSTHPFGGWLSVLELRVGFLAAVGEEGPAALLLLGLADDPRGGRQGGQAAQEALVGLVGPGDGPVALPAVPAQRVKATVVAGAGVGVGLDRAAAVQLDPRPQVRPGPDTTYSALLQSLDIHAVSPDR